jgi:hypothetical protein
VYDLRPHNIDALRYYFGTYDLSHILSYDDTQGAYSQFLEVVKLHMRMCIPVKVVRSGKRDPEYINPFVNVLLAKRNKFRWQGNITVVDKLVHAIKNIIANKSRSQFICVNWPMPR